MGGSLQAVLERRRRDLVDALVRGTELGPLGAERFVAVAGTDLLEALEWHGGALRPAHGLSDPANVRDILSTMEAKQIASDLGISPSEVWPALRTFVPRALELADRCA